MSKACTEVEVYLSDTLVAIELERQKILLEQEEHTQATREKLLFLRKLEQQIRITHNSCY